MGGKAPVGANGAIEELSAALKSAKPDVVLLIGDDQEELFLD